MGPCGALRLVLRPRASFGFGLLKKLLLLDFVLVLLCVERGGNSPGPLFVGIVVYNVDVIVCQRTFDFLLVLPHLLPLLLVLGRLNLVFELHLLQNLI